MQNIIKKTALICCCLFVSQSTLYCMQSEYLVEKSVDNSKIKWVDINNNEIKDIYNYFDNRKNDCVLISTRSVNKEEEKQKNQNPEELNSNILSIKQINVYNEFVNRIALTKENLSAFENIIGQIPLKEKINPGQMNLENDATQTFINQRFPYLLTSNWKNLNK